MGHSRSGLLFRLLLCAVPVVGCGHTRRDREGNSRLDWHNAWQRRDGGLAQLGHCHSVASSLDFREYHVSHCKNRVGVWRLNGWVLPWRSRSRSLRTVFPILVPIATSACVQRHQKCCTRNRAPPRRRHRGVTGPGCPNLNFSF
jgi:hypothetical protein